MTLKLVNSPATPDFYDHMESIFCDFDHYLKILWIGCADMPLSDDQQIVQAMQMAMCDRLVLARQELDRARSSASRGAA